MKTINLSGRRLKANLKKFFKVENQGVPARFFYYKSGKDIVRYDTKEHRKVKVNLIGEKDKKLKKLIKKLGDTYPKYKKPYKRQKTKNIEPTQVGKPRNRKKNRAWNRFVSSQNRALYDVQKLERQRELALFKQMEKDNEETNY